MASLLAALVLVAGCETEEAANREAASGQEVYQRFCFSCHAAGSVGAPRIGDVQAWAPRIERGTEAMVENTIEGMNGMPPRGLCGACTDEELEAAVEYMVELSR